MLGLTVLGAVLYLIGQRDSGARSSEGPPTIKFTEGDVALAEAVTRLPEPAAQRAPPIAIRLKPELDVATNRLRLGALNRGEFGSFRVEVIDAQNQDGNWVGPRSWPVPWLEDGSVSSKDIPKFGKPLLDFAHFDFLGLREDLEGTKWLRGDHWVFPSRPEPVKFRYSAVRAWPDLSKQYIVITLRVIRDEPGGHVDIQFKIGYDETGPYYLELPEKPAELDAAPPPDEAPAEAAPAVTDRWHTTSINAVSQDMWQLRDNTMRHPGYMSRSLLADSPPSIGVGIRVACGELDPAAVTSALRTAFLRFLQQSALMDLVRELTTVPDGARWTPRDEDPLHNFGAVLAQPATEEAPVAWARVLLPGSHTRQSGRDARCAYLVLYVEPRIPSGGPAPAASLAVWHQRLSGVLKLPTAFEAFLRDDLHLPTANDPAAELGVWLKAPLAVTELVEVDAFDVVEGSQQVSSFTGFAIATADGEQVSETAMAWLRQLCDSSLHLLDYESDLASLGGTGPRLSVRHIRDEWDTWPPDTYIAAVEAEVTNMADSPVRIAQVTLHAEGAPFAEVAEVLRSPEEHAALAQAVAARYEGPCSPPLARQLTVPPHRSVTGWAITTVVPLPGAGTPELKLSVREAVGTTYLNVIPRMDREVPGS